MSSSGVSSKALRGLAFFECDVRHRTCRSSCRARSTQGRCAHPRFHSKRSRTMTERNWQQQSAQQREHGQGSGGEHSQPGQAGSHGFQGGSSAGGYGATQQGQFSTGSSQQSGYGGSSSDYGQQGSAGQSGSYGSS